MSRAHSLSRRQFHQWLTGGSLATCFGSSWFSSLAARAADDPARKRRCILLWMTGGPSQLDTFDPKPDHANGGEFQEIATSVPGLRICEHLPKLAQQAEHLAIVRSLSTKEGDHGRGTYLMRTGQRPGGPLRYPTLGSAISKELGDDGAELPNYVAINSVRAFNPAAFEPGFLGPRYAAATVGARDGMPQPPALDEQPRGFAELGLDFLEREQGLAPHRADARLALWRAQQDEFLARRLAPNAEAQDTVYRRAVRMMNSAARTAFELGEEPASVREAYGRGRFGQGCLMARRLIERGVPFVEVSLGPGDGNPAGWDTHQDNFNGVRQLCEQLDAGWSSLLRELAQRDLLQDTTILWMGEFGRTPQINGNGGRDHFPQAWSCVFAGGGIQGGHAHGQTSKDGMEVTEGKVAVGDVLATLCRALGIDPASENFTRQKRPVKIAEGQPIAEVLR